jgi:hypothetical protein
MKLRWRHAGMLAIFGLLLAMGWELYDLGQLHGVIELAQVRMENDALERKVRKLSKENSSLTEKLAIVERSGEIDREAAQAVKADLGQLEDELQAAREEVEFYRGIVAPGDVNPGLRIHRFTLEPGLAAGQFHYDLVLTQLKRNDRFISGRVDWKIAGTRDGEPTELGLADVTDPETGQLKFRFRYFQDLSGGIQLPEGFLARQVELTVTPEGNGSSSAVLQTFNWP